MLSLSGEATASNTHSSLRSFAGPAPGRMTLFFIVRFLTPLLVLIALAASPGVPVPRGRIVALLLAQAAFGLATQFLARRVPNALTPAVWVSMLCDVAVIAGLCAATGGASSPLVFLFMLEAVAAGILLSSAVGVRLLLVESAAIIALDLADSAGLIAAPPGFPRGLQVIAAMWVVGGSAIAFSASNERELKRRNAELATIRLVTLDIEDTLSLSEILADLCRGVVEAFRFSAAAVLLREGDTFVCRGSSGATGPLGANVDERGPLLEALDSGLARVVSSDEARIDATMADVVGGRGYVVLPLGRDGALVATRAGRRGRPGVVRTREIEALASLAHHAVLALANAKLHAAVSEMAIRDPLTSLLNHGEFQRLLAHEAGRAERFSSGRAPSHGPSLMMIDIDHFKALNDRFGHPAGDRVLIAVARAISSAVRSFDIVARYGGEEFAVVLPETDSEGATQVAERVLDTVRRTVQAPGKGGRRAITVSIGIATAPVDGSHAAELISRADDALYRSKEWGRDRVTTASVVRTTTRKVAALNALSSRRRAPAERRARAGSRRAPAPSSRPTRRTPRGR